MIQFPFRNICISFVSYFAYLRIELYVINYYFFRQIMSDSWQFLLPIICSIVSISEYRIKKKLRRYVAWRIMYKISFFFFLHGTNFLNVPVHLKKLFTNHFLTYCFTLRIFSWFLILGKIFLFSISFIITCNWLLLRISGFIHKIFFFFLSFSRNKEAYDSTVLRCGLCLVFFFF